MSEKLYTPQEVADICKKTIDTVWRWIRTEKLKAKKTISGSYLITEKDLENFLSGGEKEAQ